jgi:hypothetical protein
MTTPVIFEQGWSFETAFILLQTSYSLRSARKTGLLWCKDAAGPWSACGGQLLCESEQLEVPVPPG